MRNLLLVLIFVCAAAAITTVTLGYVTLFQVLKPSTTVLIILLFMQQSKGMPKMEYWVALLALLFCLLGDTFLLSADYFVFGLAAFFIAHIGFLITFVRAKGLVLRRASLALILLFSVTYYVFIFEKLGELAVPVAAYFSIIILLLAQAFGMAKEYRGVVTRRIAVAALLFAVSDSLIALNKFVIPFDASSLLVLSLYWASITVLAVSLPQLRAKRITA